MISKLSELSLGLPFSSFASEALEEPLGSVGSVEVGGGRGAGGGGISAFLAWLLWAQR